MRIAELVNVARPTDTVVLDQIIADQASFPIIGCSNWEDATFTEWRPHWTDHLQWLKNLQKSLIWTTTTTATFLEVLDILELILNFVERSKITY